MFDRSVLWSNDARAARAALETLLTECQGNVTLASRRAGIERQSMHRLLKRHGLSARDFRPRGGGSIIARAALKNLDQQLTPPQRTVSRDFTRTVIREAEVHWPGVTVTHPAAVDQDARQATATAAESARAPAPVAGSEQRRDRAPLTTSDPRRDRVPLTTSDPRRDRVPQTTAESRRDRVPLPTPDPRRDRVPPTTAESRPDRAPLTTSDPRRDRVPPTTAESRRDRVPLTTTDPRRDRVPPPTPESRLDRVPPTTPRDRASLAAPSLERPVHVNPRPTDERLTLLERPITAGELADRAFERRRAGTPHHRPYQSPLGAAALHALALRKTVVG